MLEKIRKLSIATKLIISFSLIIVLFIGEEMYSHRNMMIADQLYQHHLEFVVVRREYLYRINLEFAYFRAMSRNSIFSPTWRAGAGYYEWRHYERAIDEVFERLISLADSYNETTRRDIYLTHEGRDIRIDTMSEIKNYLHNMHNLLRENFFMGGQQTFYESSFECYRGLMEYSLNDLLEFTNIFAEEILLEIEETLAINRVTTIVTFIIILLIAIILAWLMILSFTSKIRSIEGHVSRIRRGDFDTAHLLKDDPNDEISRIIVGMVEVIVSLIYEINSVAQQNDEGIIDARMDENKFEGGYREAAMAVNQLITSIKENHDQARDAAENSEAKSRFLARMSHEIRTPLTAVLGISEIQLQVADHSLAVEEAFAKIHNSASILLKIVNDILDLSKIEAGKMDILDEKYELGSVIIDVVQMHLVYLGSKKIHFQIDADDTLPAHLVGDELRLKQILNNLLSNAFKYTDSGNVDLIIKSEEHENPEYINLVLTIKDTGQGMTAEQISHLMQQEYVRFNEKENRFVHGFGLGMPIVFNLITLMGATILIESKVSEGTSVKVCIPQRIGGATKLDVEGMNSLRQSEIIGRSVVLRSQLEPDPMPYGRVLVVDDIDTNLYVAKGLLTFYDLQIDSCTSGNDAIERVRNGEVYDVIFMDHMMPELDGIKTTQILRMMDYKNPIVALTANALIGQAEEFLNNGFDGFISKPIQAVHLNGILNRFVRDRHPEDVVEEARRQRKERNETTPDIMNFIDDNVDKLRKKFIRSQKNVMDDIRASLDARDMDTAQRLVHTLKGLAGFIRESDLSNTAFTIETKIKEAREIFSDELDRLERELKRVVEHIDAMQKDSNQSDIVKMTKEELLELFDRLEPLLTDNDTASIEMVEQLVTMPDMRVLARLVEDCEFKTALTVLRTLRKMI